MIEALDICSCTSSDFSLQKGEREFGELRRRLADRMVDFRIVVWPYSSKRL